MVSKLITLGAVQAGLVFKFGGNFDFLDARADQTEDVFEEFATDQSGFRDELQFVLVFEETEWF